MAEYAHIYGQFLVPDESARPLSGRVEFVPAVVGADPGIDYPVTKVLAELDERGRLSRVGSSSVGVGLLAPGTWTATFQLRDRRAFLPIPAVTFTVAPGDEKWITRVGIGPDGGPLYEVTDLLDGTALLKYTSLDVVDHGDGTASFTL